MPTTVEILRKTKAVLVERGWHQGDYTGPDGSVCLLGALHIAACGHIDMFAPNESMPALARINRHIGSECDFDEGAVLDWNDSPRRTLDDVYAMLDRAIQEPVP